MEFSVSVRENMFFRPKSTYFQSYKLYDTVVTPDKGQSIFGEIGSNKGTSEIPLFVIFNKWYEIRDFRSESDKNGSLRLFNASFRSNQPSLPSFGGTLGGSNHI